VLAFGAPTDPTFDGSEPVCIDTAGCPDVEIDPAKDIVAIDRSANWLHLGPAVITEREVAGASAELVGTSGTDPAAQWVVTYRLTPAGAAAFGHATTTAVVERAPRNQIAILVDGVVASAPVVVAPITSGDGEITGNFTEAEARDLAASISPATVSS